MSTKVLIFAHSNLMIYLQPLIYDVLHTEGDFYLGNPDARQKVTEEGENAGDITNDEKAQSVSSEVKTKKRGGPKPKRSKKGKR